MEQADWGKVGKVALIDLDKNQSIPGWTQIRAFVETGSRSSLVLATLANYGPHAAVSFSCVGFKYGDNYGVLISVLFNEVVGDEHRVKILIAHKDAQSYQEPILYPN
jgi:hypothetical protein